MPRNVSNDPRADEIEKLRQEVRALRNEIAGRVVTPAPRLSRGMMAAAVIGVVMVGTAMMAGGTAIDLLKIGGVRVVADAVSAGTAVGIVERLFTVY
jgi:hypothetical protein